jgi:hypothetical protein
MSAKTADLASLRNDRKAFTSIEEDAGIRRVAASWVVTSYHAISDRHGILASRGWAPSTTASGSPRRARRGCRVAALRARRGLRMTTERTPRQPRDESVGDSATSCRWPTRRAGTARNRSAHEILSLPRSGSNRSDNSRSRPPSGCTDAARPPSASPAEETGVVDDKCDMEHMDLLGKPIRSGDLTQ